MTGFWKKFLTARAAKRVPSSRTLVTRAGTGLEMSELDLRTEDRVKKIVDYVNVE